MKLKLTAAAILSSIIITGCSSSDDAPAPTGFQHDLDKLQLLLNTNADLAFAKYSDSVATAELLKAALTTFESDPSAPNLQAAKDAWLVAREPYGQTEVYRFRNSPIDDDPATAEAEDGPEGSLNAWPLGEALIDYVQASTDDFGDAEVGVTSHTVNGVTSPITAASAVAGPADNIIGNTGVTIDAALLANSESSGNDVLSGYHAIEFLLWGQDLNNAGAQTTSADRSDAVKSKGATIATGGERPLSDFNNTLSDDCTSGATNHGSVTTICQRRHSYMEVATQQLIDELTAVRDHWAPNVTDNYRASFTTVADINAAKGKFLEILTGMGTLSEGELAGERMQISLAANSQEDEHSCFSDNTHRDIWLNAEGVSNSYTGTYAGYDSDFDGVADTGTIILAADGYGINDYLADTGATALAANVAAALATTKAGYMAIDTNARANKPVDVVIVDAASADAAPMRDTVIALNAQSTLIAQIAVDLELGTAADVVDPEASGCDTTNPTVACP